MILTLIKDNISSLIFAIHLLQLALSFRLRTLIIKFVFVKLVKLECYHLIRLLLFSPWTFWLWYIWCPKLIGYWLSVCCVDVLSPISSIYWIKLGFINNYKEFWLWLDSFFWGYNAYMADTFSWVITNGIRGNVVILCGLRDTSPQSGSWWRS